MSDLSAALLALRSGESLGWVLGVVTNDSPFTVRISGDSVDVVSPPFLQTYSPVVDDIVFILRPAGSGFIVIGAF